MLQTIGSAFELNLLIRQLKSRAEEVSLDMGAALYKMESEKLYLELDYPTFEAYLASPEIAMSRRTAYVLKSNYEKYVLELHVQPVALLQVGETKLDLIRAYITPENQTELLAMGTSLSKSDLRIELAERFNGGIEIRPYIDWESVADELYKDLFTFDGTCQLPGCKKYKESKRTLKREGWNE